MTMKPVPVENNERLYFRLMLRGLGVDPKGFNIWKFAHRQGERIRVRVFGRGSAAVYDVPDSESWTSLFASDLKSGRFGLDGPPLPERDDVRAFGEIAKALETEGIGRALELLNQRVPHRFTAVYELRDNVLHNVALVDKESGAEAFSLAAVPLKDSFCQFVLRDGSFATASSANDERLAGHPYCGVVGSYVGVPVPRTGGGLYGTLCHFDFATYAIPDEEFFLLGRVAQLVAPYLPGQ
jgi:hypothetical protein